MKLQLEELEAAASEDVPAVEIEEDTTVHGFARRKPLRALPGRTEPAGDDPGCEVRSTSTTEQKERSLPEGINLDVSTLADRVGASAALLAPLVALIKAHEMAEYRIHGDDTTVPVLAKGKTTVGQLWTYVRDDRPFAGPAPPAAIYFYSPDRTGHHPKRHLTDYAGILKADAYASFNDLYISGRKHSPIAEAGCWAHGQQKLFELTEVGKTPLAAEAVRRVDAIFAMEREINGATAEHRLAVRRQRIAPLVTALETWMRMERGKLSRHADVARAVPRY